MMDDAKHLAFEIARDNYQTLLDRINESGYGKDDAHTLLIAGTSLAMQTAMLIEAMNHNPRVRAALVGMLRFPLDAPPGTFLPD